MNNITLTPLQEELQARYGPRPAPHLPPGSPEWRQAVTATKVPSILGVDAYGGTRYSMWHTLAGNYSPDIADKAVFARGRCLERGVADWWLADHPDYDMEHAGGWQHPEHDWAFATPDFLLQPHGDNEPLELLEVKTSARMDGFGDPELGIIPPNYWAQIVWQAVVTGVHVVNLTVLGTFLERKDYRFEFDPFTLGSVFEEVQGFVDTLPGGVAEWEPLSENPAVDWQTILAVTPVVQETADVSEFYTGYAEAKRAEREAHGRVEEARKSIMAAAASAEVAVAGDVVVAKRNKAGGFRFSAVKG